MSDLLGLSGQEVAVAIEGQRGRRVAQHPLQHLHIGARSDGKRSARVPEVVVTQRSEAGSRHGGRPSSPAEVLESEVAALGRGKRDAALPGVSELSEVPVERVHHDPGDGHSPPTRSALRSGDFEGPADPLDLFHDGDPAVEHVDMLPAERDELTGAQPAVRSDELHGLVSGVHLLDR